MNELPIEFVKIIESIVESKVKEMDKADKVLVATPMIVVTSVANGAKTALYYPSDLVNPTQLFTNRTGSSITAGQKVYLVHPRYSQDEGWIGYVPQ